MIKIADTNRVLVAVGNAEHRGLIVKALTEDGHRVIETSNGNEALDLLKKHVFQLVITDLKLEGTNGPDVIQSVQEQSPVTPIIMTVEPGAEDAGIKAMMQGAFEYRELPLNLEHLRLTVHRALEKASLHHAFYYLRHEQPYLYRLESIVAESPAMQEVLKQVAHLAPTHSTVLITGETGVGKNLIAGAVHANSPRREAAIVTVSCATLAENLLESELFGHEKGAFTGAVQPRTGRFQQAHGGTLFLDEVGEISPQIQAKLLRAIEEQLIYRLGGSREIHVNVRIIAATNRDLGEDVKQGVFRRDLFYRLNVTPILIPPLRERREDILPLVRRFTQALCKQMSRPELAYSPQAEQRLIEHQWQGNVRELRNVVERTVLFTVKNVVESDDILLGPHVAESPGTQLAREPGGVDGYFVAKSLNLEELEKQAILSALDSTDWVQSKAAELLGLTPSSLSYKLNRLDIKDPRFRSRRRR